jgi:DNA (cytosine-5)-methyltransferase 1
MSLQSSRKSSLLQIRLDEDLIQRFAEVCQSQGIPMSSVVRTLIDRYCERSPVGRITEDTNMTKRNYASLKALRRSKAPTLSVAEMYCGPGGIALGADLSSFKHGEQTYRFSHAWATDYDPDTCQTYATNILSGDPTGKVFCEDVREIDINSLPAADGFLYGFPCNDFSNVGESKGLDGTFGPLYKYGVEYINAANPLFIFAENVSGLSSANAGSAFETILDELSSAGEYGYTLTTHLYKFEQYGIPQARHRYIIVGMRKDTGLRFEVPRPSGKVRTCKDAIENPPISSKAKNNELTAQSKQVVERLKHIKPGENAWTADLPDHLRLNVTGAQLSQIYKRLDPSRPSYTVTGSGGGGTHVYHWREPRALTNRERARLQTFPDDFVFVGSKESVRKQIGMAVPPMGAKVILTAILKTFAGVSYAHVSPSKGYLNQ